MCMFRVGIIKDITVMKVNLVVLKTGRVVLLYLYLDVEIMKSHSYSIILQKFNHTYSQF